MLLSRREKSKVNVSLAISLFAEKQVSLAKAAELANKSLADFMDILKKLTYPGVNIRKT